MPTVSYLDYTVVENNGWSLEDDNLFEKARNADLGKEDYGTIRVSEDEYILQAAESVGLDWPFSCRAGACANCASVLVEGEVSMDMQQILSQEEIDEQNIRLTCIGSPDAKNVKIVYNAKHLDYLQNRVVG